MYIVGNSPLVISSTGFPPTSLKLSELVNRKVFESWVATELSSFNALSAELDTVMSNIVE